MAAMGINMNLSARDALKPWLEWVQQNTTTIWQEDLDSLFLDARNRYPDVVWEIPVTSNKEEGGQLARQVWGHQAIIRARTVYPAFNNRYLPSSVEAWPSAAQETSSSPDASTFLRLTIPEDRDHAHDLRFLYTADVNPGYIAPFLLKQLRKDLISMWKRRLSADVQINLPVGSPNDSGVPNRPAFTATFLSHRFILSSRSSRFRAIIAHSIGRNTADPNETLIITFPSQLFTPESLRFILIYIYSGTLEDIPHRGFDLSTAFFIFRGSLYLDLPDLEELILAQMAVEMLHGLYHAPLSDTAYMKLVSCEWTKMAHLGCQCEECARHAPRVLQFALEEGISNGILERGARRALVGLFGKGWCTDEFAALPEEVTHSVLMDIEEVVTPRNIFPLLFAAENALFKLNSSSESWGDSVKRAIFSVRGSIDKVLCANARTLMDSQSWRILMKDDQGDSEILKEEKLRRVTWVMWSLSRGISPQKADALYQALSFGVSLNITRGHLAIARSPIRSRFEGMQLWRRPIMGLPPILSFLPPESNKHGVSENRPGEIDNVEGSSRGHSSAASFYSCISKPDNILSLEEPTNAAYNAYMAALDLATISLYSLASSRTVSTDYGVYYTRWAISQETIQEWDSIRPMARRRSWDSFRNNET